MIYNYSLLMRPIHVFMSTYFQLVEGCQYLVERELFIKLWLTFCRYLVLFGILLNN